MEITVEGRQQEVEESAKVYWKKVTLLALDCGGITGCGRMAKLKDVKLIPNLHNLCSTEGFNLKFRYIGGRWVWIMFENEDTCDRFRACKELDFIFCDFVPLSLSFVPGERMDLNEPLSIGKACILTPSKKPISEEISVDLDGTSFEVWVKEIGTWAPNIGESVDGSDSESDFESIQENVDVSPVEHLVNATSEDPFSLYKVIDELNHLEHKSPNDAILKDDNDRSDPCSASPSVSGPSKPPCYEQKLNKDDELGISPSAISTGSVKKPGGSNGGSFINDLSLVIQMGKVLGYDMAGCSDVLGNMINRMSVKMVDQ
ncbi:hypothetical protein L1987_06428 [Smallanthus sonchifolius]|uniref:Uncharacterized protein n=1 Tax=Smallanthus sonchifolius TaxID=185202 RepID=A0ACB9JY26_9ASTR|nr:hypothetical protein L1987_06428 [Smallanthus sonchifolius]